MHQCSYCHHFKFDNEFSLTIRKGLENSGEDSNNTWVPVAYLQSWCKECTTRKLRVSRGTQTRLDVLVELVVLLDNEFKKWMRD